MAATVDGAGRTKTTTTAFPVWARGSLSANFVILFWDVANSGPWKPRTIAAIAHKIGLFPDDGPRILHLGVVAPRCRRRGAVVLAGFPSEKVDLVFKGALMTSSTVDRRASSFTFVLAPALAFLLATGCATGIPEGAGGKNAGGATGNGGTTTAGRTTGNGGTTGSGGFTTSG